MKTFILIFGFLFCAHSFAAVSTCDLCTKLSNLSKAYEEDEGKAYEAYNSLLSQVELSKDQKIRALELENILKTSVTFLKSDERRELPDYLSAMNDEYPKDFKAAAEKVLSKTERADIEEKMKVAKDLLENGEEPKEK